MTILAIYPENGDKALVVEQDPAQITQRLAGYGVSFERWQASASLSAGADQEQVIAVYQEQVDRLMDQYHFKSVDVVSLGPDHPDKTALRNKFLSEHTHSDFEVRFFVAGSGLFYIHAEDKVFGLLCEAGDLISVPANLPHWFDMGENPDFKCIRLFTTPEGWVAEFTGDAIAARFPSFEQFQNLYQ